MTMPEILQDILTAMLLAPIAYFSTNLDNLIILSALSHNSGAELSIRSGFIIASVTVFFLSLCFVMLGYFVRPDALGYLGIVPIALGVRQLLAGTLGPGNTVFDNASTRTISIILIANSADTIAVFGPLFAESKPVVLIALAAGFAASAAAWLVLATYIRLSVGRSERVGSLSRYATPLIMICIGVYVLMNTGTDVV